MKIHELPTAKRDREPGEDDELLNDAAVDTTNAAAPLEADPDPFAEIREEWWAAQALKAKERTSKHSGATNGAGLAQVSPILDAEAAALVDWITPFPPSIPTGIPGLDAAIEGFHAETTYCLMGPTGRGKTGMALQMARAASQLRPVVYFTSELSRRQVLSRIAAQSLRRAWVKLYKAEPEHAVGMSVALKATKRIHVVEIGKTTDLFAVLAQVAAQHDGQVPIMFLDYLQHAARRLPTEDIRMATAELMDKVTDWARSSRSIAVVLSSTGRAFNASDGNKRATDYVAAGGETSVIEYNAGSVLFLQTEDCPAGGTAAARLHVAKARFLGTGATVGLRFDGAYGSFDADPEAALTELQRRALAAIREGAQSAAQVQEAIECRKQEAQAAVRMLVARGLVAEKPLRPLGGLS